MIAGISVDFEHHKVDVLEIMTEMMMLNRKKNTDLLLVSKFFQFFLFFVCFLFNYHSTQTKTLNVDKRSEF